MQIESLNADGSLPEIKESEQTEQADQAATGNAGVNKYQQFCVACHGADGAASGAAALAMNPRPRNFQEATWQDSVDDTRIAKVIKEGGASVGLSATMVPWGALVNDSEVEQIIAHIRSFKK